MKRKMIKAAAVLAAMVLALVLSACSNGGGVYIVYVDDDGTSNGGASGGGIGGGSDTGSDNALTVSYAADLVGTWKVTGDSVFIDMPNGAPKEESKDPSVVAQIFDEQMYSPLPGGYNGGKLFDENNCVTFSTQNEAEEFIERMNFMVDFIGGDIEEFANILTGGDESELTQYIVANGEYDSEAWCVINGSKDKIQGRFYFTLYCEAPDGSTPLSAKCDVKITLEKQSSGSEDNKNPSDGSDTEIPFETGKYFIAIGNSEGIEIIPRSGNNVKLSGSFIVEGIPLTMGFNYYDGVDNTRRYLFPFAEKGKKYTVRFEGDISEDGGKTSSWKTDSVQCVAGGGLRYEDYLNVNPVLDSTLDVKYVEDDGFVMHFTPAFNKTDVIKNSDILNFYYFYFFVVLGDLHYWPKSLYWSRWFESGILDRLQKGTTYISDRNSDEVYDFDGNTIVSDAYWKEYGNKYCSYINLGFSVNIEGCEGVFFSMDLWSDQKYYKQ